MAEYVLQVGAKGFDRLKFLNDVFGVHSRGFLCRAGVSAGSTVLEVGCGSGSMTTWIAETVGAKGKVIAVDISDKQIGIAQKAVQDAGFSNVEFICSPVESISVPEQSIDLAYSRFLLMHLTDPLTVLTSIRRLLKPGGVMACEEPQSSSLTTVPVNKPIERLNELFIKLGALRGLDFNIGERLMQIMRSAGYSEVNACFVQPAISMTAARDFVLMGAAEVAPFAIQAGLIDKREAKAVVAQLEASCFGADSYYTFPRQAQVYSHK